jgi:hypothetical protein
MKNGSEKQFTVARWTKATFWGWLIGVVFILMLSSFLGSIGIEDMQFYLGVGMGAGVGLAQWWMLRKYVPITQNWIWLSVIGMSAPFAIIDLIPSVETPLKLALSVALGALTVGALQYLLLKKHLTKASLWFWACFIGWTLAVLATKIIDYTMLIRVTGYMNLVLAFLNLFIILAGGVILGVISGIALKKMLA